MPTRRRETRGERQERTKAELATLHARVAAGLVSSGQHADAIDHWLEAGRFEEALTTLTDHGRELVRTSPGALGDWLERLPLEFHEDPAYLLLKGHLLWGAGQHEEALDPLGKEPGPATG